MAIVLALMIVGWLVAFALGAQAGFESQPSPAQPAVMQAESVESAAYAKPATVA